MRAIGTVLVPLNSSTFLFNGTLRTSAGSCKEKEGLSELAAAGDMSPRGMVEVGSGRVLRKHL
jgi:hypothetical protein